MTQPIQVANAWNSVKDEWIVRRNKAREPGLQWEVVHDWGGDIVSDATRKILGVCATEDEADAAAKHCEDEARGAAVIKALKL